MMKTKPLLFAATLLLAACGGGGGGEGNEAGASSSGSSSTAAPGTVATAAIRAGESLTGLYEKKEGGLSSQLCLVERGSGGAARFGLNLWGGNMHSCSGAGTAVRKGQQLTLTMEGDRTCSIEARIDGNSIRLPDKVPEGCSYYCGAQARMTGVSLARTGTTEADALKARDVVDEPLCETGRPR